MLSILSKRDQSLSLPRTALRHAGQVLTITGLMLSIRQSLLSASAYTSATSVRLRCGSMASARSVRMLFTETTTDLATKVIL